MKKSTFIFAALIVVFAMSCNRAAFEKKLVGEWQLDRYLYAGKDETVKRRDTTMNQYKLTIGESQVFSEEWRQLTFSENTVILPDTLGFDSANSVFIIDFDTVKRIDTGVNKAFLTGWWDLINSEADLQLHYDSTGTNRLMRILQLSSDNLKLKNGNEELYLKK